MRRMRRKAHRSGVRILDHHIQRCMCADAEPDEAMRTGFAPVFLRTMKFDAVGSRL